jgi:sugar lactone lactonase YvrE
VKRLSVLAVLALLALLVCACSVDPLTASRRPCDPAQLCGPGAWCQGGVCTDQWGDGGATCTAGQARCASACVDTNTDVKHCGGCGKACGVSGERCVAGHCVCGSGASAKTCGVGLDCVAGACRCVSGGRCSGCCADSDTCVALASQAVDRCGSQGAACKSCDDKIACTTDRCATGGGACANTMVPGFCYIQATCIKELSPDPKNPCQRCESAVSAKGWTDALASGCVGTVAGTGNSGYKDGPVAAAQFHSPYDVAVDAAGVIYVVDTFNHVIRTISGGQVSTLAGSKGYGYKDGPAAAAKFSSPLGVAVDSKGAVYVGDTGNNVIRKIYGGQVSTVAGDGTPGYKDGPVASARFEKPGDLALDAAGTVYLLDTSHRVRKICGGVVSTVAGDGVEGYKDGPAASARFSWLHVLALDASGTTIYISESIHDRIRVITKGVVSTLINGPGYQDGPLAMAKILGPSGLAVDQSGAIYIADTLNFRLRKISGGQIRTVAGDGIKETKDGLALTARFLKLDGIAFGPNGDLYLAQPQSPRIRVYRP